VPEPEATLILPHKGGGKFFRELDAPQLCCGALHCRAAARTDEEDSPISCGFIFLTYY